MRFLLIHSKSSHHAPKCRRCTCCRIDSSRNRHERDKVCALTCVCVTYYCVIGLGFNLAILYLCFSDCAILCCSLSMPWISGEQMTRREILQETDFFDITETFFVTSRAAKNIKRQQQHAQLKKLAGGQDVRAYVAVRMLLTSIERVLACGNLSSVVVSLLCVYCACMCVCVCENV